MGQGRPAALDGSSSACPRHGVNLLEEQCAVQFARLAQTGPAVDLLGAPAPGAAPLIGQHVPDVGEFSHIGPHVSLGPSGWLVGGDKLLVVLAETISAGDNLSPLPFLWHILESHRAMFFHLAAAGGERSLAHAGTAGRDALAVLCTTCSNLASRVPSVHRGASAAMQ